MTTKHAYTVCGHYPFPSDMLRYDESKPLSAKDESKINALVSASDSDGRIKEIHLVCEGRPNIARWNSFGWSVTSVRRFRKEVPESLKEFLKQELLRRSALANASNGTSSESKAA